MKNYPIPIVLACLWALAGAARSDEVRFLGNKVVEQGESIAGDLVVVTGDLVVRGHIAGSCVAYVGDITLDSSAVVDGDVVAKSGHVNRLPGATVAGDIVQGHIPRVKIGRDQEMPPLSWDDEDEPTSEAECEHHGFDWELDEDTDIKLAYNKVDGFYLGAQFNEFPVSEYNIHFRTFGSGGYAFASHSWQGRYGFGFGFLPHGQVEISLDAYHLTATEDAWYMSDTENSLAAFFLHEDFRDYYLREGFSTGISWKPANLLELGARYQAEQHRRLENATEWALFGGDRTFLPNLPAEEGMLREFLFTAGLDTRNDDGDPTRGWKLQAQVELTNPDLASDFDYRRALVDLRRYQLLGRFINLDMRVRLGNSDGELPLQKRFFLGGPSSLPGFGLKEFSGREFALGNMEFRLHGDRPWHHSPFGGIGLIFFADAGMAADQPLADLDARQWASDVGFGVCDNSGSVRLQVARRTDTAVDPYVWMFRIQRPF